MLPGSCTTAARALAAVSLLSVAAACGGSTEPTPSRVPLRIVSGGSGSDTVLHERAQALVVEARDSAGAPLASAIVRFTVQWRPRADRVGEAPLVLCEVTAPGCDAFGAGATTRAVETNAQGRAILLVAHGTLADTAVVRVTVPQTGAVDSARFVTRAGSPHHVAVATGYETVMVGRPLALPTHLRRFDAYANLVDSLAVVPGAVSGNLTPEPGTVTAAAAGRGWVELRSGALRDTVDVYVVPAGRIAFANGNTLVVANMDGTDRRDYAGLTSVLQYGLRPTWARAGDAILVHSGMSQGRVVRVTLASGALTALTSAADSDAQWYPDGVSGAVYFTRELAGSFGLWRMGLDGAGKAAVATTPAYGAYYRPAVTSDGGRLAVQVIEQGGIGVRTFALPSGAALSSFVAGGTAPRWSPDGAWVAFSSPGFGPIRVMRADGSGLRTIAPFAFGEWFDWTADGEWIVASADGGVGLVRVWDGELMPLPWAVGMWQPAVRR